MRAPPLLDAAINQLAQDMCDLQHQHRDLFAFANAWAERHDAIIAATPALLRPSVEQQLHRIGVRWGVAQGVRATAQFPALKLPTLKRRALKAAAPKQAP
ncbi:MAG: hypothetical protein M3Q40_02420 [Pseudomonadota bacterium]|nr:hypothetical protein [Pseudomonadota bacterium]